MGVGGLPMMSEPRELYDSCVIHEKVWEMEMARGSASPFLYAIWHAFICWGIPIPWLTVGKMIIILFTIRAATFI